MDAIKDLDIGASIDNVSTRHPFPVWFHELSDDSIAKLMEIKILSAAWIIRMVITYMAERKHMHVINVSSIVGMSTSPLLAQCSAATSCIEIFSKGLAVKHASKI